MMKFYDSIAHQYERTHGEILSYLKFFFSISRISS